MNFKKPFKVLTTAALIGTLSLSAVAPGASASSLDKKVSAKAETKASVENVVLKNKAGELLTLPLGDYLEAKAAGVDFDGAEPVSISTNGKYYSLDDYLEAKASTTNKTEEEAFKLLGGNEQDIKPVEGQINKDGSVTPKEDATEEFEVTEIAAINGTQIEVTFNKAPKDAPKAADFQIEGLEVKSVNAKAGSDKTFVITTDAQTAGKEYTLKYGEQTKAFTAIVEVAAIEAVTTSYAQQVGKEVTVEYKVVDQNGKPVAGKEVYFRAGATTSSVDQPAIEKTATSDANGVAKFTFTRKDEVYDSVTAYVVDQPLVRNTEVTVQWTIAPVGLINVTASQAGKVGHNTVVEYTLTAKDKDGVNLERGSEIDLNLVLNPDNSTNSTTPTVEIQRTNGTWETVSKVGGSYTLELKEAGKAKVRVIYANPASTDLNKSFDVTPTFQYDLDDNGTIDTKDPIAIAPRLTFVKQVPTLTLTPKNDVNVVSVQGKKEYTLKAVDQFGNPFRGTVNVNALEIVDGLSGTAAPIGAFTIEVDSDNDGVFEIIGTNAINFGFGNQDLDENGEVTLAVKSATNGNALTLAAFYDEDGNGFVGAKEASATAPKITFGQAAPSSIKLEAKSTTVATGGDAVHTVTFLDADGKEFKPEANIGFALYNTKAKEYENLATADVVVKDSKDVTLTEGTYTAATNAFSEDYAIINGKVVLAPEVDKKVTVELKAAKFTALLSANPSHTDYKLVAYSENGNPDGTIQLDELQASSEFTIEAAQATKGKITTAAINVKDAAGTETAIAFNKESKYQFAKAETTQIDYTYTALDQSGNDFDVTADTRVIWVLENTGEEDATVAYTDFAGTSKSETIEAGKTLTINTKIASGSPTTTVDVTTVAGGAGKVNVQAQTNVATTLAKASTLIYDTVIDDVTTEVTYSGSVAAFNVNTDATDTKTNNETDRTFFVLSTGSVGEVLFDTTNTTDIPAAKINYVVGGNTANEAAFEKALTIGSTVSVKIVGGVMTITLN